MAKLLVQESNGAREFELVDLEVNIGRELDNTLRLADPSISRHHAVIRLGAAGYEISDLESSNGVLLNGTKVPSGPLHDGDRITLGQMQLTFVDPPPPAPASSPLGTVRMDVNAMAKLRASTLVAPEAAAAAAAAALAVTPAVPRRGLHPPQGSASAVPAPDPLARPGDAAAPSRPAAASFQRGGLATRFLASLVDFSPMLVVSLIAARLAPEAGPGAGVSGHALSLGSLLKALEGLLLIGYLVLLPRCWMRSGASLGKKLLGLRVVPEQDPEGRVDLSAAVMRLLGYLANGVISAAILAAFLKAWARRASGVPALEALPHGAVRGVALAVAVALPCLLILGRARKGLEDRFSRSIVIKGGR